MAADKLAPSEGVPPSGLVVAVHTSASTTSLEARLLARSYTKKMDDESAMIDEPDLHVYSSRYDVYALPSSHMPVKGIPAAIAYQGIHDLRDLDHNPRLNMASFVTTWMEEPVQKLIMESLNVNFVDMDEYPSCTDIHNRCVSMLSDLYNSPDPKNAIGTGTLGSSEAIMLAGLAMKKRWQGRRRAAGLPTDKPNMVLGFNCQVCWEKFCVYWDVEAKFVHLTDDCFVLTPEKAKLLCDENTIGVCGILGSTYNGEFEDIVGLDRIVEELRTEKGYDIPVHVDAASGGFVAPFLYPELLWDFRLKNVKSINVSGHKYGLVYAGIGWVLWRTKEDLPEELVFHVNYLGTDQPTVTLNFSRGASHIIAQYYQLVRMGRTGYTRVMNNLAAIASRLAEGLRETEHFDIVSKDVGVPLVAFKLRSSIVDGVPTKHAYDEFEVADKMKEFGWVVPAYTLAPDAKHITIMRCVIREDMSMTLIEKLLADFRKTLDHLNVRESLEQESMQKLRDEFRARFAPHRMESNVTRAVKHDFPC